MTDIDKLIERAKSKLLEGKLDEVESIVSNLILRVFTHSEIGELFQEYEEPRQSLSRESNTTEHEDHERPQTPDDENKSASASNKKKTEVKSEPETEASKQTIIKNIKSYAAAAAEAIEDKDFSNAEKCLLQAEKLDSRLDVKSKLSYDRTELASRLGETNVGYNTAQIKNIIDAHKYIDRAKKALSENKFEQAIRFLTESMHIYPTAEAKDLMDQINKVKDVYDIDGRVTDDHSESETTTNKNNESTTKESPIAQAVSEYIGFALDEMANKCFYSADSWLKLANGTHKTPIATHLLQTVNDVLKYENLKNPTVQDANKNLQAKHYLKLAEASLIKNEYDTARLYVVIAQNITNMVGQARDLMHWIFVQQYSKKHNVPSTQFVGQNKHKVRNIPIVDNFKKFAANRYYECAEIAFKMGNGALAQEYMEKYCEYNKNVGSFKHKLEKRTSNKKKCIII